MKLMIVESPSKAKTIGKYLGDSFRVVASVGHIRDLPKSNKKAIDIKNGFKPHYEIVKGREKVISEIRDLAEKAEEIIIATDPDREGEAIAWHVVEAANLKNLKSETQNPKKREIKRIVFHEITKEAVEEALLHPRKINQNLRHAQEARRVLDRIVGYDLSGIVWKKVRYGLSAGRVQSPALRIIAEREREIKAFKPEAYHVITAETETLSQTPSQSEMKAKAPEKILLICEEEPRERAEAERIEAAAKAGAWLVFKVIETEVARSPRAPFITSTLQQAASSRLGFSPSRTMRTAQKLYEAGLITYMRTDSSNLSEAARASIKAVVSKKFGEGYSAARIYARKVKNAQEAHEAIRPTDAKKETAGITPEQKKLYDLIWRRAVSSQMADAKIARAKIVARVSGEKIPDFAATGSRVIFDGWLKADPYAKGDDVTLPKVKEKTPLELVSITIENKETEPPPRYTEARLIKELEKRGIGRPSTYATIMKTLGDRGYAEKDGQALRPTDTGEVVSSFLEKHFSEYISDDFTAKMENELDSIANGDISYKETLSSFYGPFEKEIKSKEKVEKVTSLGDAPEHFKCPICGKPMEYKLGRSGRFISCKRFPDCNGALTAEGKKIESPKETGEECPKCKEGKLVLREGRFGSFIACSRYPKCKFIKKDEAEEARKNTGITCPVCKTGSMVEKRGRFGIFYSCSNYPECKNTTKAKPTGKICPLCGSLMMEGTKTIPERCSNKLCKNHRPERKTAKKSALLASK